MTDTYAQAFATVERAVRVGLNKGLELAGEHVLGESNAHTPLEEGPLERSGKVTTDTTQLQVAISYNTPYAVAQHENLTYAHDPGRTALFLENALNAERSTVDNLVAAAVRRELGT